jgi:formylglycine-generating enzyme required for sulfatase activity/serine/threonine protein kinase
MNTASDNHPSAMVLEMFGEGRLTADGASAVLAHLDICPECRQAVMTRPADSLLQRLRAVQPTGPFLPEVNVEQTTCTPGDPHLSLPEDVPLDLPPELRDHKQYSVERELGRGGMGVVYLARDGLMNRLVVLKIVNSLLVREARMRERFLREIQLAASLRHSNVVTAYHAEQIGQLLVLVMEYAPGETLEVMMVNRMGRPLPVVNACYYAQQVARGLQHAFEQGLVHRDIKPANLILTVTQKKTHLVRILDFGLAKAWSDSEGSAAGLTGRGAMMGTPAYMAPEQSDDAAQADIRADIYSLGCTLYFLLAGRSPFEAKSLRGLLKAHASQQAVPLKELRSDVPAELSSVVAQMMEKDPARRYAKPEEVARALAPFLAAGNKLEPQPESSPRPEPQIRAAPGGATRVGKAGHPTIGVGMKPGNPSPPTVLGGPSLLERPTGQTSKPARRLSRKVWLAVGGVTVALYLVVLWALGVFHWETDGILVLETDDPTVEVFVDETKVPLTRGADGRTVEFGAKPGTRSVVVYKAGVFMLRTYPRVRSGERQVLTDRLVADASKLPDSGQIPPQQTGIEARDTGKQVVPPVANNKSEPGNVIPPAPREDKPNTGQQNEEKLLPGERWEEYTYQVRWLGHEHIRWPVWAREFGGLVKMEFVRIVAKDKTFTMGSPEEEVGRFGDEVEHRVKLSVDYYLGKTAVTRGQFAAFVKDDGYKTEAERAGADKTWRKPGFEQTDHHPVVYVTWNDAVAFCKWLSRMDGREYRLPTEAQWEYACRAGMNTAYSYLLKEDWPQPSFGLWGGGGGTRPFSAADIMREYAWYGNVDFGTNPVGKKKPNMWGLYDMHGNVSQWCSDVYGAYPTEAVIDPQGPAAKEGSRRVIRGGAWNDTLRGCRSANRNQRDPTVRNYSLGFRVAVPVP